MRCDNAINETLEMLGSFTLIEEILNSDFGKTSFYQGMSCSSVLVAVFIIRLAERRIDQLLDAALLDYTPLSKEFESVEFESEWSFLRTFGGGKKKSSVVNGAVPKNGTPNTPKGGSRPPSPNPPTSTSPTNARGFASLRQTFARTRASSNAPLQSIFADPAATSPPPSPKDITSFITALHTLLTLSGINPAIIIQLWSQVMYWTACRTLVFSAIRRPH